MRQFSLSEIVTPVAGRLVGPDAHFRTVSTDSRRVAAGDLFVALKGEQFDGHRFVAAAAAAGACGALVSEVLALDIPMLQVSDTRKALGRLGALNRDEFDGVLVGITGSCGKTSVKNMLAAVLASEGATLATPGNFNNEIGMPLTLLELNPSHRFAVIEMGAGRPGDIAYLCGLARPQIAVLLNAMPAHLETMGSLENVAQTKGEILSSLGGRGTAVFPAGGEFTELWRRLAGGVRQLQFGFGPEADVRASEVELGEGGSRFVLHIGSEAEQVTLRVPGHHNVANALAAAAAAWAAGLALPAIKAGLAAVEPAGGRLHRQMITGGISLIDDSYNANPASVKAAIDVLAGSRGRRILVLGTMAELGPAADRLHAEVGRYAAEQGIDELWTSGTCTEAAVEAFGPGARYFDDRAALTAALKRSLTAGDVVLVKGSRSAGMDAVVASLAGTEEG